MQIFCNRAKLWEDSKHPDLCYSSNAAVSVSFRWEEECTMRMDLQQRIVDLQEVILCRPWLCIHNVSLSLSSSGP